MCQAEETDNPSTPVTVTPDLDTCTTEHKPREMSPKKAPDVEDTGLPHTAENLPDTAKNVPEGADNVPVNADGGDGDEGKESDADSGTESDGCQDNPEEVDLAQELKRLSLSSQTEEGEVDTDTEAVTISISELTVSTNISLDRRRCNLL